MQEASDQNHRIQGHKGLTELAGLNFFDLARNQVIDDLHPWFEGATNTHFQQFLKKRKPYSLSDHQLQVINRRIRSFTTPTDLSRKPRDVTKIGKWTGTELRNFLLHYSVPILQDLLPARYLHHWCLLANAAHLLHKNTISEADLVEANQCIHRYQMQYEEFFGPESMFFNIHMLGHSVASCENWGPMWAHSTFPFESWNFKLLKYYKSPKDPIVQMVRGYQLMHLANTFAFNEDVSPAMREEIKSFMYKARRKNACTVNGAHFLGDFKYEPPNQEELQQLQNHGLHCDRLQIFDRVLFNSIEFRSPQYNPDARSNNTYLYTYDDRFCRTEKICIVHHGDDRHCGLFARELDVPRNAVNAPYIAACVESDNLVFLQLESVQALCVKAEINGALYVSPIPNHFEID